MRVGGKYELTFIEHCNDSNTVVELHLTSLDGVVVLMLNQPTYMNKFVKLGSSI